MLGALGAGGMGEVYRARDERLSRSVALKVLPAEISADKSRLERFEKEARAASSLNHPNIVTVYDIGSAESTAYIAMELVEGRTLRELLHAGPVALRRLLSLAAQIADGLAKAHAAGIVHRDLKPENLMVTKDGFVKILDFGLAKLVPAGFESSEGSHLVTVTRGTEPGTVLGTVGYMSPEQASGHPIDFRSDQFSLGAILYEMAAGKRAFEKATAVQTLSAIIQDDPEPISSAAPKTPANLVWMIERCLAKEPEERYGSTKDLARDLAALRDHGSEISSVRPEARAVDRRLRVSRPVFAAGLLAALALAAVAFFGGQRLQFRRDRETPPPTRKVLTHRRGFLTGARFAPDGQTIVYSARWDGKPSEIFTTRVGSSDSRPLGIFPAGILAISSAGEMAISLGCENRWDLCFGTLARVPLAGGTPREVLENVSSADWSPDGKELAVIHVVEGRDRLEYPIGKVLYQPSGILTSVRVSPKGDLVAFFDHPDGDSSRARVALLDRGGHYKALTGEWSRTQMMLWSPAGDEIFFETGREQRVHEIHAVNLSGRIREVSWIPALEDVSRDGLFLDIDRNKNLRKEILALVPGASKERSLSWLNTTGAADLSPDGRDLLMSELVTSAASESIAFMRRTDGSDPKMLGEGAAQALSRDGKWALTTLPSPEPHFVLLPTGAGEPRSLPGGGILHYHGATFFPDGRRILFAAEDRNRAIRSYIQDVAGGPPRPFAEEGFLAALVSPDGLEIAGSTLQGLYLIFRADGEGRARAIAGAEPGDFLVQWSADGKSIFVRGLEERPLTVYRVDLATGKRERWKELAPLDMAGFMEFGGVRITPDGRFYAYSYFNDLGGALTLTDVGKNWWK